MIFLIIFLRDSRDLIANFKANANSIDDAHGGSVALVSFVLLDMPRSLIWPVHQIPPNQTLLGDAGGNAAAAAAAIPALLLPPSLRPLKEVWSHLGLDGWFHVEMKPSITGLSGLLNTPSHVTSH